MKAILQRVSNARVDIENKTVGQIDIRKKYNINIMAFRQNGKLDASVSPDTLLTDQITLLVLGEYKALQKCFKI